MTDPAPGAPWARRATVTGVVAVVLVIAGLVAALWRPWAPSLPPVATDLDRLAPELATAIARYRAPRRMLALGLELLAVAVPVALVLTAGGRRLLRLAAGRDHAGWRGPARGALVAVVVVGLGRLLALPAVAWAGLVQDGAWGVRTAPAAAWWGRVATGIGIELVVMALLGAAVVWLLRRRPRAWVGDVVVLGVLGVAVATVVWPAVVLPLTTPVEPLGDGPQAAAVRRTLDDAGLGDLPVAVQVRSDRDVRSNAVVHGLGPTRRVVIDDTLLARPVDEVVAVVAHELAHQQHRDVERAVLASAVLVALLAVAVHRVWADPSRRRRLLGDDVPAAPHDPRVVAVALAVAAVVGLAAEPVALWHSRRVEAAADAAAFRNGAEPATTVRLQRRLAIDNLGAMAVPTWERLAWWSHPTPAARIRAAVARAERTGEPLPDLATLVAEEASDPPAWWPPPGRAPQTSDRASTVPGPGSS